MNLLLKVLKVSGKAKLASILALSRTKILFFFKSSTTDSSKAASSILPRLFLIRPLYCSLER